MQKFPSSIFSFETLTTQGWLTTSRVVALVVALAVLVGAEATARLALEPTKEYWEYWDKSAADHFLWYRRIAISQAPVNVVIGDSTASRNFDPKALSEAFGQESCFNLGWPANFPLALEKSTIPLLSEPYLPPKRLILSLSPNAFTDHQLNRKFEAPILRSPLARRLEGETLVADYLYLARLNTAKKFSASWFTGKKLFREPSDGGALLLEGREERARENLEEREERSVVQHRFQVIERIVELANQRSMKLVVVIPPRQFETRQDIESDFLDRLYMLQAQTDFQVVDCRRLALLRIEHFHDPGHLNREGAGVLSRYVALQIQAKDPIK